MEFRHLEVAVAVADLKSFSKAADYLYLTQPTISSHINSLEKELQVKLFNRTTKSLQVTPEGEQFIDYARRIIALKETALNQLESAKHTEVRMGVTAMPSLYLLPTAISGFEKKHPDVHFELRRDDRIEIEDAVMTGSMDLGLTGSKSNLSSLNYTTFATAGYVIMMPNTPHYKKLLQSDDALSELMKEPMLVRDRSNRARKELLRILSPANFSPNDLNVIITHNDAESIIHMVENGAGIYVTSELAARGPAADGRILCYPLPTPPQEFFIVTAKRLPLSESAQLFYDHISNIFIS